MDVTAIVKVNFAVRTGVPDVIHNWHRSPPASEERRAGLVPLSQPDRGQFTARHRTRRDRGRPDCATGADGARQPATSADCVRMPRSATLKASSNNSRIGGRSGAARVTAVHVRPSLCDQVSTVATWTEISAVVENAHCQRQQSVLRTAALSRPPLAAMLRGGPPSRTSWPD